LEAVCVDRVCKERHSTDAALPSPEDRSVVDADPLQKERGPTHDDP
jgi:hypothetical protein